MVLKRTMPWSILQHAHSEFIVSLGATRRVEFLHGEGLGATMNTSSSRSCTIEREKTLHLSQTSPVRLRESLKSYRSMVMTHQSAEFTALEKNFVFWRRKMHELKVTQSRTHRSPGRPSVCVQERARVPARFRQRQSELGNGDGPRQFAPRAPCVPGHLHYAPRRADPPRES